MEASTFEQLLTTDEMFFVKESRYLAALAARMKVPPGDIEDLVQEAWLSVLEHLTRFVGEDVKRSVHCWLALAVHGKAVDLMRHLGCCPCESLTAEDIDLIDEAEARHAETAEIEECLEVLLEKVRSGNEENLLLFCLHFFQGFSIQEIAQHFDRTVDAVDSRIRRVTRKLRELVEESLAPGKLAVGSIFAPLEKIEKKVPQARRI